MGGFSSSLSSWADNSHCLYGLPNQEAARLGQYRGGASGFAMVCCKNPDIAESYRTRDEALQQARRFSESGDIHRAIYAYWSALEILPTLTTEDSESGPVEDSHGTQTNDKGSKDAQRTESASSLFTTHPMVEDASIYEEMGQLMLSVGNSDRAIEAYERAITLDPSNATYHYRKGVIHHSFGDYACAIACFERALTLRPNYVAALFNLGVANRDLNRLEEAMHHLHTLLALDSKNTAAMLLIADCYERQSRFSEALQFITRVLELDPTDFAVQRTYKRLSTTQRAFNAQLAATHSIQLLQ